MNTTKNPLLKAKTPTHRHFGGAHEKLSCVRLEQQGHFYKFLVNYTEKPSKQIKLVYTVLHFLAGYEVFYLSVPGAAYKREWLSAVCHRMNQSKNNWKITMEKNFSLSSITSGFSLISLSVSPVASGMMLW